MKDRTQQSEKSLGWEVPQKTGKEATICFRTWQK